MVAAAKEEGQLKECPVAMNRCDGWSQSCLGLSRLPGPS